MLMGTLRPVIEETLPRDAVGAPCECGGYADKMDESPIKEEIEAYDCGRPRACCTSAFRCRACKREFIARLEAPELGW